MSGKFEAWGLVEIMGRSQVAGRLSEEVIAGAALLRVDVPQSIPGEAEFRTEYIGASAIYRMHVTTEGAARALAARYNSDSEPTYAYGLRMQSPALTDRSSSSFGGASDFGDDPEG